MQVSVEKTSELSRKMTVSVPEEVVQEKMAARLKSLAREVKIDGFRPGKVPPHVVKKMFGDRVRGEITGDLIQSTYYEAIQNHDLKPAGYPHIHPSDENEGFKYTAEFEVYPEISLEGVDQLEIVRPVSKVEDIDVDDMIEKLRAQKKYWVLVERESADQDRMTINFSGTSESENFTDGKVEDFYVEIGAKKMIPGFEDNLIGIKAGESKNFSVTFPEDYGNAKLAGKEAEFQIEVTKVEEPKLPDVDEAFIKEYGVEEGSVASFREDVRNNMERELIQALHAKLKNAVMDALYAKIQIAVPTTLVDQEIENLMEPYKQTAKKQKINLQDLQLPTDVFEEQAKRRVTLGLIMAEIIQKNTIQLDANKVRSTIEDMAKSYERPEDVVNWYYADPKRLNDVQQMVLEDQTIEWLVSQSKVSESAISFGDVMDKR
ncbi:MAG: trigger factor [Methylococcaceae bacterium]|nr:trigger factor [Methylococcaceae bacterium]